MVSASRYIVVISRSVGNVESRSACGTYREMSSTVTAIAMLNVSSTSSSGVGSGTIIMATIETTRMASARSE